MHKSLYTLLYGSGSPHTDSRSWFRFTYPCVVRQFLNNNTTGSKPCQVLPHLRITTCTNIINGADTTGSNLELATYKVAALPIKLYQQLFNRYSTVAPGIPVSRDTCSSMRIGLERDLLLTRQLLCHLSYTGVNLERVQRFKL